MMESIWDYLNSWIRKKFKETFTEDGAGNTAFRVVGTFEQELDLPNQEEIINETLTLADTEYAIVLPTNLRRYWIYARDGKGKLKLSFVPGETATNYVTIDRGYIYDSENISVLAGKTIYLLSSSSSIEVEVRVHRKL